MIDELAAGGDGVGRADDGRVVFVPFTAPGDRVRVRVDRDQRRFLRAHVVELLVAGSGRTDPVCAVFGSCGGCAWQHVGYDEQVAAKRRIVEDAFARIAGVRGLGPVAITPSPSPYGYRSRARVLVAGGRVGFRRRHSHALCATRHCPILTPPLQAELANLADAKPEDGEWELFGDESGTRATRLPAPPGGGRMPLSQQFAAVGVSPGVFAQGNAGLLGRLAAAVHEAAGRGGLAFDLYAGAGFLTLGLARRFERVLALESDAAAVADLVANLRSADCASVEVIGQSLEVALAEGSLAGLRPDVVVLDPPRAGLPEGAADALVDLAPERIVYLSCDPATQARDAGYLIGGGYDLERVEAFDLFPQTPHVESLAVFGFQEPARIRVR